jgi:hypothetical protein
MVDTTIAPANDRIVVHDGDGYRNNGPQWSAEPTFGQTANAVHIGDSTAHILNALHAQFGLTARGQGDIRSDVRDSAHGVSRDVTSGQRDILGEVSNTRDATRQEGTFTRERIQTEGRNLSEGQGTIRREIAVESGNIRKDICETQNAIRVESSLTREVVKDQVNTARMEMLREFGLVQLKAAENTAAIQLEAQKNTAALARQLDECCCEVKELVRGEATATRELFNATEAARLRDALADAKAENGLLQILAKKL